jgi:predicted CopG family antitoxin
MVSKNPRIRVTPEVLQRLKEMQREGESESDVVQRLLNAEGSGLGDLPEEARTRLREILDVLDEPLTAERAADAALRMWAKLGAVLGHREGTGLGVTQKANIVSFFKDDDPTRTRMRLAIGALQELWRQDEVTGLLPILESVTEILGDKAVRLMNNNSQE